MKRFDSTDGCVPAPCHLPLLQYIAQHWLAILAQEKLEVKLQLSVQASPITAELFIGDEFWHGDKRYLDVVIKADLDALAPPLLPSVLVFDKHAKTLVGHELNGLQLQTAVIATVGAAIEDRQADAVCH